MGLYSELSCASASKTGDLCASWLQAMFSGLEHPQMTTTLDNLMEQTCHLAGCEAEAGELKVRGLPRLQREFKSNLGNLVRFNFVSKLKSEAGELALLTEVLL